MAIILLNLNTPILKYVLKQFSFYQDLLFLKDKKVLKLKSIDRHNHQP
jgi:hypothetical protein